MLYNSIVCMLYLVTLTCLFVCYFCVFVCIYRLLLYKGRRKYNFQFYPGFKYILKLQSIPLTARSILQTNKQPKNHANKQTKSHPNTNKQKNTKSNKYKSYQSNKPNVTQQRNQTSPKKTNNKKTNNHRKSTIHKYPLTNFDQIHKTKSSKKPN